MRRALLGTSALLSLWIAGSRSALAQNPGQEVFAVIPVVISAPGVPPSLFRTAIQIHNPTDVAIHGQFLFRPQAAGPGTNAITMAYALSPGETQ
jgi:hypothetical protein